MRHLAVILPHLGLYGGNLRYLELGDALAKRGVDFTIATPDGARPGFLEYRGRIVTFDELRSDPPEVLLASEQSLFDTFREMPAGRKLFYFILEKTAREKEIAAAGRRGEIDLLANSTGFVRRLARLHSVDAKPVIGGINLALFRPVEDDERERKPPGRFRVLANGRFARRRKGTRIVAKAVDGLARRRRGLELELFDTSTVHHAAGIPPDFDCRARVRLDLDVPREKLRVLYGSADVFVSAEKRAGWSNPTIEAMACGLPVVCTRSGTTDFAVDGRTAVVVRRTVGSVRRGIRRLMEDRVLRGRLAGAALTKVEEFTWERTAGQLLEALGAGEGVREGNGVRNLTPRMGRG